MPHTIRALARPLVLLVLFAALLLGGHHGAPAQAAPTSSPQHSKAKARTPIKSANMQPEMVAGKVIGLESGQAKGVYCNLVDTGFNAVTLDIPLLQTSKTGTTIVARPAGPGTSPTPTDDQLRTAIRDARACGISSVILKPHLELPGGEWRAHIKGSAKWQRAWTKVLLTYAKIGREEQATTLVIGTEQRDATTTSGSTGRWNYTVTQLRKADPKHRMTLTYAAHTNDELLRMGPSWVRRLDYVSATWYPRPPSGVLTVATLEKDMRLDKARYFDKAYSRYGHKRLVFAEVGFRSIGMASYFKPRAELDGSDVDLALQARQYEAMFRFTKSLKYCDGWMLYRYENTTSAGGAQDPWFSPQGKPAAKVIESALR